MGGDEVSEQPILIRRRPTPMGGIGRFVVVPKVLENPLDDGSLLDARDHLKLTATMLAGLNINREYPLQTLRPSERPVPRRG